jgi:hypothetical protein
MLTLQKRHNIVISAAKQTVKPLNVDVKSIRNECHIFITNFVQVNAIIYDIQKFSQKKIKFQISIKQLQFS